MKLLWKMQFPVKYASHTHCRTLNLLNEMIIHIIIVKVFFGLDRTTKIAPALFELHWYETYNAHYLNRPKLVVYGMMVQTKV